MRARVNGPCAKSSWLRFCIRSSWYFASICCCCAGVGGGGGGISAYVLNGAVLFAFVPIPAEPNARGLACTVDVVRKDWVPSAEKPVGSVNVVGRFSA